MCSQLRSILPGEPAIPIVWLFQCQTIEALAARLAEAAQDGGASAPPPLLPVVSRHSDSNTLTPLTFQQVLPTALQKQSNSSACLCMFMFARRFHLLSIQ